MTNGIFDFSAGERLYIAPDGSKFTFLGINTEEVNRRASILLLNELGRLRESFRIDYGQRGDGYVHPETQQVSWEAIKQLDQLIEALSLQAHGAKLNPQMEKVATDE